MPVELFKDEFAELQSLWTSLRKDFNESDHPRNHGEFSAGELASKASRASQVATHHSKKAGGAQALGAARDAERHSEKAIETGDPKHHDAAASSHREAVSKHIAEYTNNGGDGHIVASKSHGEAASAHTKAAGAIRRENENKTFDESKVERGDEENAGHFAGKTGGDTEHEKPAGDKPKKPERRTAAILDAEATAEEEARAAAPPIHHPARASELIGKILAQRAAGEKPNVHDLVPLAESLDKMTLPELTELRDKHGLQANSPNRDKFSEAIYKEVRKKLPPPAATVTVADIRANVEQANKVPHFMDDKAGLQWADQNFGEWAKSRSKDEVKALQLFGDTGSINAAARGQEHGNQELFNKYGPVLDKMLADGATKEPVTLWRGIGSELPFDLTTMVGGVWRDAGYSSTSYSQREAAIWTENDAPDLHASQALLKVSVPAGTPAGFTDAVMRDKSAPGSAPAREILLGRGLNFRVVAADRPGENGNSFNVPIVHLEVMPGSGVKKFTPKKKSRNTRLLVRAFVESDHPRDVGKFSSKPGSGASDKPENLAGMTAPDHGESHKTAHAAIAAEDDRDLTRTEKKAYGESIDHVYGNLTSAAKGILDANKIAYKFWSTPMQLSVEVMDSIISTPPTMPGVSPEKIKNAAKDAKKKILDGKLMLAAGFMVHSKTVNLDGDVAQERFKYEMAGKYGGELTQKGIYAHEIGHAIDAGMKFSGTPEWQTAWKEEIANEKLGLWAKIIGTKSKVGALTTYAGSQSHEGFAEFSRLMYGSNYDTKKIEHDFPKCAAFFKQHKLWVDRSGDAEPISEPFNTRFDLGGGSHVDARLHGDGVKEFTLATKALEDQDVCPTCGMNYAMRCRCRLADMCCDNGHDWHNCAVHGKTLGTGHGVTRASGCTCPEEVIGNYAAHGA